MDGRSRADIDPLGGGATLAAEAPQAVVSRRGRDLFRRSALDEVGAFDPSFFLFNEEVDLCRRLVERGWALVTSDAVFVHLGGIATRPRWDAAYREQLRSHLRMIEKHEGARAAEQTRRYLVAVFSAKALVARDQERRLLRDNATWLRAVRHAR